MKKRILQFSIICLVMVFSAACSSSVHTMKGPNAHVQFKKSDFSFSDQVSAEATATKVFTIDFARLTKTESGRVDNGGSFGSKIPVIGIIDEDPVSKYALFKLMKENPGYDVVFYPQFEKTISTPIGLGLFYRITTVKVTARLGKIRSRKSKK